MVVMVCIINFELSDLIYRLLYLFKGLYIKVGLLKFLIVDLPFLLLHWIQRKSLYLSILLPECVFELILAAQ